jgi:hypothetical protein
LYLNFSGAFFKSMFYIGTNYTWITNMYFSWFNRLGFNSCYKFCRCNCSGWHNWYLFFFYFDKFPLNDQFDHNWYRLMLI